MKNVPGKTKIEMIGASVEGVPFFIPCPGSPCEIFPDRIPAGFFNLRIE